MDSMSMEAKKELVQKFLESSAAIDNAAAVSTAISSSTSSSEAGDSESSICNVEEEDIEEDVMKETKFSNKDDVLVDDGDDTGPIGEEEESPRHTYYCTRNGLFYKTYDDMVKAKQRCNQNHLRDLGLDRAAFDLKEAVTGSKNKNKNNKKRTRQQQQETQPLRRSTRRRIPVIPPPPPPPPILRRSTRPRITVIPYAPPLPSSSPSSSPPKKKEPKSSNNEDDGNDDTTEEIEMSDTDDDEDGGDDEKILDTWTIRYRKLKQFRKETGHCRVPCFYPPNRQLGSWVNNQRYQYRQLVAGKKSYSTQERIKKLNKIGFRWNIIKAHNFCLK